MKEKLRIVSKVGLIVFLLDHLTKYLVVQFISRGQTIPIVENFFDLVHTRNTGAAFGFLAGWDSAYKDYVFYALFLLAFIFLYSFLKEIPETLKSSVVAIGMIVGGAFGNIVDRLFRGSVVDFLSFHWYNKLVVVEVFGNTIDIYLVWPAFNIADSGITLGVCWLLITMIRQPLASKTEGS